MVGPPPSGPGRAARELLIAGMAFGLIEAGGFIALATRDLYFLIPGILALVVVCLVYGFVFAPTRAGAYAAGRTPALALAITSFVGLALLSGIFYVLAYVRLGDADRAAFSTPMAPEPAVPPGVGTVRPEGAPRPPLVTPMPSPSAPAAPTRPAAPPPIPTPGPPCPRCGRPLILVEAYQRWFCPSEYLYL